MLSEAVSKTILEAYGIPTTRPSIAATAEEAVRAGRDIGYPVVLKILSPDIIHKSDLGGVALDLKDDAQVRAAFKTMMSSVRRGDPKAALTGATVQKMADLSGSVEMILGAKKDPVFGTVLMVGMGGTIAELFHDKQIGFPPLNEKLVLRMLESLKIWPLLTGFRGHAAKDVDKLIETIIRLSYLVADYPEISELDINPLVVAPKGVLALDVRIALDRQMLGKTHIPYSHLALRPYPEEYVRVVALGDGSKVTLRPIKPEDEPLWFDLLRSCSKESIYMRFRYFFHWDSHEVASRYCFIDYDREIAIVAEVEEAGKRRIFGIGRMVADPDHEAVEYAILVSDAWQNRGLGGIITDYCLEIARHWGLKRFVAQTTSDNPRMIAVFRKRGFTVIPDPASSLVEVSKELT
jgi:acetyltransferase